jgi:Na+-transporting methylmalonyl-CoA/oxaloacetate decarboxylase gamma subunit
MLIVFGFLLILVAAMFALNIVLKKILPGSLRERPADQKFKTDEEEPAGPSDAELVAAMVASIKARISAIKG